MDLHGQLVATKRAGALKSHWPQCWYPCVLLLPQGTVEKTLAKVGPASSGGALSWAPLTSWTSRPISSLCLHRGCLQCQKPFWKVEWATRGLGSDGHT